MLQFLTARMGYLAYLGVLVRTLLEMFPLGPHSYRDPRVGLFTAYRVHQFGQIYVEESKLFSQT